MRRPTHITLRCEEDLLALIPYTLGFVPEDSLVQVTLTADGVPFHARVDLPDEPAELDAVADVLVAAAVRNAALEAVVVLYTADACLAEVAGDVLAGALAGAGVRLGRALRTDGSRWYPIADVDPPTRLPGPDGEVLAEAARVGIGYDLKDHPLTSQAVLEGRVTSGRRSDLVASLDPVDGPWVAEVAAAVAELGPLPDDDPSLAAEAAWLLERVRARTGQLGDVDVRGAEPVGSFTASELPRVVRAVQHRDVRDMAWAELTREQAGAHVRLWTEVVRRCPEPLVASPAGLLAFASWLHGDGALAWCAVDRAFGSEPRHSLALLVRQALEGAVPPSVWRPLDPRDLRLSAG